MVQGGGQGVLHARTDAEVGFAIGDLDSPRTQFTAMIDRVRGVVDGAASLIDERS